jgi:hypothetical protein
VHFSDSGLLLPLGAATVLSRYGLMTLSCNTG